MRWPFLPVLLLLAAFAGVASAVPMTWDVTGHVDVATMVDGKGPYPFILDTGADESAVYAWFAKSLDLPKGKRGELSGVTGSQAMVATRLDSLTVAGHAIRNVQADTVVDRADGVKIAGIVGVDTMRGRLAVLDFGCGSFDLEPRGRTGADVVGGSATLVRAGSIHDGLQLTLPVALNGVPGIATLDTGAPDTMINRKYAALAGIDIQGPAFKDGKPVRGATMVAVTSRVGPIGTVRFAGVTRADVTARVLDAPFMDDAALAGRPVMNLGLNLLLGTRLTVDYSARRFWVAPSSCGTQKRNPS